MTEELTTVEKVSAFAQRSPVLLATIGVGGGMICLWMIGGYIVTTGMIAGTLLAGVAGAILWKMRSSTNKYVHWLYEKAVAHPLLTDLLVTLAAFAASPAGIVGWVSATVAGGLCSVWLLIEHALRRAQTAVEGATA